LPSELTSRCTDGGPEKGKPPAEGLGQELLELEAATAEDQHDQTTERQAASASRDDGSAVDRWPHQARELGADPGPEEIRGGLETGPDPEGDEALAKRVAAPGGRRGELVSHTSTQLEEASCLTSEVLHRSQRGPQWSTC